MRSGVELRILSRTSAGYHRGAVHALYTLAVVLSPWFAWQALRYRKYVGGLAQRMGYLPVSFNLDGDSSIWIHAVSVGEALTARALVADLRARYPGVKIFVS